MDLCVCSCVVDDVDVTDVAVVDIIGYRLLVIVVGCV